VFCSIKFAYDCGYEYDKRAIWPMIVAMCFAR